MQQDARQQIEMDESLRALEDLQRRMEQSGQIPVASRLPLRRHRSLREVAGGMALGVLVSGLTALFNFIVFNWLLHIGS